MKKLNEKERPMWEEYWSTKSIASRNALVVHYMFIVDRLMHSFEARLAKAADFDDLRSAGYLGLMNAVELFNPEKNTMPRTYIIMRVRGAMIDHLRDIDPMPRKSRSRLNQYKAVEERLACRLERQPTSDEMLAECAVEPIEFSRMERVAAFAGKVKSFTTVVVSDANRKLLLGESIEDKRAADPAMVVEQRDLVKYLLDKLPPHMAMAATHYLMSGFTMKQTGKLMDFSEGAISQWLGRVSKILLAHRREVAY